MDSNKAHGLHLFEKEKKDSQSLKLLLQLLRSQGPGKYLNFAYVEGETSLIPHLGLRENLHVSLGDSGLRDLDRNMMPELKNLLGLIKEQDIKAQEAQSWEIFIISLVKGMSSSDRTLIIDMNEDLFSPLMVMNFKKVIRRAAEERPIYLASAMTAVWLDSARCLIKKKGHVFSIQELDWGLSKRLVSSG